MSTGQLGTFIRSLRRLVEPVQEAGLTDAELLQRFVAQRDEAAFEVLLWRHGPMVLQVCRRVLGQEQDIEDAFQATFLALVRKGAAIGRREAVAGWLYRVAYRVALRDRLHRSQRMAGQRPLPPDVTDGSWPQLPADDLNLVLDAEVNRLPERFRVPFVLCCLQGKTYQEAALELGCPKGTIASRLTWARKRLRSRLTRRGVVLSGGLFYAGLSSTTPAGSMVPAPLVQAALQAATATGTGSAAAGLVSERAVRLAKDVLRNMTLTRWRNRGGMVAAFGLLAGASGLWSNHWLATAPAVEASTPIAAPATPTSAPGREQPAQPVQPTSRVPGSEAPVQAAVTRAQKYLKSRQRNGNWEQGLAQQFSGFEAGPTALVLLALLESGLDARDEAVAAGLSYLRGIRSQMTYVASLQTLVLCQVAFKAGDQALVQRNVDYLLQCHSRSPRGAFYGWSYGEALRVTDNSNTEYAVRALGAAARRGIRIDSQVWKDIREYYLLTQQADGGWCYSNGLSTTSTLTMTCAGASGLLLAGRQLDDRPAGVAAALDRAYTFLGRQVVFAPSPTLYYRLSGLARLGRLSGKKDLGADKRLRDWYRKGADYLVSIQQPDGNWKAEKAAALDPVLTTSFALLFLGKGN
jgi:RNA polymerase sigma factor (sigma-70 family)